MVSGLASHRSPSHILPIFCRLNTSFSDRDKSDILCTVLGEDLYFLEVRILAAILRTVPLDSAGVDLPIYTLGFRVWFRGG